MRRRLPLLFVVLLLAVSVAAPAVAHEGADHAGLAAACPRPIPSAGFDDTAGNSHADAIDCLAAWGITSGTSDGRYSPAGEIGRAQLASFLLRLIEHADQSDAGVQERDAAPRGRFDDVDAASPHARAIDVLAHLGIVAGTSDATYSPAQTVSRAQMATFLARALDHLGVALPAGGSSFDDTAGNTHADAIDRVATAGIANGTTSATYEPSRTVTRAQMASFVMRAADELVTAGRSPRGYEPAADSGDAGGTDGDTASTDDPGPKPGTAADPCTSETALEDAFAVTITAREQHTNTDNSHPAYSCLLRTDGGPWFSVTVDGWVPAPDASEVAAMYSMRELFLGDAGIGHSAVVQHADEHNRTWLYVDLGETSFEIATNSVEAGADEQSDVLLHLARTVIPQLWPDHDFSRTG